LAQPVKNVVIAGAGRAGGRSTAEVVGGLSANAAKEMAMFGASLRRSRIESLRPAGSLEMTARDT